ncbi:RNA-binding family protein with retrovirus zinc finger-like domain isoform 1 [Hibiscus syriacus]|uniref:RNA-binding family protein with retrovirus zinc finger-like domain isoform 1 n=1 Tax=Hibiscus syriacus TaxID=106335 RepID=A0A6A2YVL8_HIBSY|nr:RNA-binding family protein with retrovirus zinc finger-like domain isoform 1 [Hibiscus syriacus]
MLADEHMKRVVIVDTSNEIGDDGDVHHEGIGRARRMQVPNVNLQHNVTIDVIIKAIENHLPKTIIIDEIGSELEALASSTIAQRGVQLVGTTHGMTVDNIIENPSLWIFVCGTESATLCDEEARKRKLQKTILERKGPPTFTCVVEMISKTEYRVDHRLDATVDAILAEQFLVCMEIFLFEIRQMEPKARVLIKSIVMAKINRRELSHMLLNKEKSNEVHYDEEDERSILLVNEEKRVEVDFGREDEDDLPNEIDVIGDIGMADAVLASASKIKQNMWIRGIAKFHWLPMFVIKSDILGSRSYNEVSNHELNHMVPVLGLENEQLKKKQNHSEKINSSEAYVVANGTEAGGMPSSEQELDHPNSRTLVELQCMGFKKQDFFKRLILEYETDLDILGDKLR